MNGAKIQRRAFKRAEETCLRLLVVQKAAGAGLSPDVSLVVGDLCMEIEMLTALNKRLAKSSKRSTRLMARHEKSAGKIGTVHEQVAELSRMVPMNPTGWRVKLEKVDTGLVNGSGRHE